MERGGEPVKEIVAKAGDGDDAGQNHKDRCDLVNEIGCAGADFAFDPVKTDKTD